MTGVQTCALPIYSKFMNGVKKAGIEMNRKTLSEMAINDTAAFAAVVEAAKAALN